MAKPKKIEVLKTEHIWATLPSVIDALKLSRQFHIECKLNIQQAFYPRGVNATILLLAAASIEGFLAECLECFADRTLAHDKFDERLRHFYLNRLSWMNIEDKCKLFVVPLGDSLGELMAGKAIQKDFMILCKYRNVLAHANSLQYSMDEFKDNGMEFTPIRQEVKEVRNYLIEKKLLVMLPPVGPSLGDDPEFKIIGIENLLTNKIADYFAAVPQQYMEEVTKLLPQPHKYGLKRMVETAYGVKVTNIA